MPLPKFHYEQRQFNIVKCNTDLTESELEIEVARGIGYGVSNPKDVDTFVKVELPYPQVGLFFSYSTVFLYNYCSFFIRRLHLRHELKQSETPTIQHIMKSLPLKFTRSQGPANVSSNDIRLSWKFIQRGMLLTCIFTQNIVGSVLHNSPYLK